MSIASKSAVLTLLKTGSAQQRVNFVQSLPPNGFKEQAASLIAFDKPGLALVALGPMINEYCNGRDPTIGTVLAEAAHERALELWDSPDHNGLLATTLSGLALNHVKALGLLGRSEEVLTQAERYINLYEAFGEHQNLPAIKVTRADALVNLHRIDDASKALRDEEVLQDPVSGMEARRLRAVVEQWITDAGTLKDNGPPGIASQLRTAQDAADLVKAVQAVVGGTHTTPMLNELVQHAAKAKPVATGDPEQLTQLTAAIDVLERAITKGGKESEIAQRSLIIKATGIFAGATSPPELIRDSLSSLTSSLEWTRRHGISHLENEALWGIYLCHSRLNRPSDAADALLALRTSLERLRAGKHDSMQRAGIFSAYPHLFDAMCAQLDASGRTADLLKAMESSKGRVIADKLAQHNRDNTADQALYASVAQLPALCRRLQFHYLACFVDTARTYAVLVSRAGELHHLPPLPVSRAQLREAAEATRPLMWGTRNTSKSRALHPNAAATLQPVTACLEQLLETGVLHKGDHICYSPDGALHNIPLQYLVLGDGIVLDQFSVSRVPSCVHLVHMLAHPSSRPQRYTGFVVPTKDDLDREDGAQMLDNMKAPLEWLAQHRIRGETLLLTDSTPQRLLEEAGDARLLHFSTHGWFPPDGNPYHDSYLLLAGDDGLARRESAARGTGGGRVTPKNLIQAQVNLQGCHVSMMACLSGLAREGIGGDALGLDWALIQSGASTVVSAHWPVSARAASKFFQLFYQHWLEEQRPRSVAWRQAMLTCMGADRSPASLDRWSGFSLTGDFR